MKKENIFTVPNLLSVLRLILVPIYCIIFIKATPDNNLYIVAVCIFLFSILTDMVDGYIARRFNQITQLGKFLDPLADKVTQGAMLLCLAFKFQDIWFLVILFFVKEACMFVMGAFAVLKGYMPNRALFAGKFSTTALFVSMFFFIIYPIIFKEAMPLWLRLTFDIICFCGMLWSLLAYIISYIKKDGFLEPIREGRFAKPELLAENNTDNTDK